MQFLSMLCCIIYFKATEMNLNYTLLPVHPGFIGWSVAWMQYLELEHCILCSLRVPLTSISTFSMLEDIT